jgi:ATP synthase protein I
MDGPPTMTTESKKDPRASGARVLLGAAVAALVLGFVAAVAGAIVDGSAAAYGALVGTGLVLAVLGFGSMVVDTVAGLIPNASLMVALLTYTLQVVLMGLVLVALTESGLLDGTIDREWLAGVVIAGTFGWLTTQVVLTTRMRIPVYDLPVGGSPERVGAGTAAPEQGGDRP